MPVAPAPVISLPRRHGNVTVRQGGLDDDLDALNEGNALWWGKDFLADRIATSPPDDPWLILVAEVEGEAAGYGFLLSRGLHAGGRAMCDLYVLPRARQGCGPGPARRDGRRDPGAWPSRADGQHAG